MRAASTASRACPRAPTTCEPRPDAVTTRRTQTLVVDGDETLDFTLPLRTDSFGYTCVIQAPAYIEAQHGPPAHWRRRLRPGRALPFTFAFYGQSYNTAFVTTNGHLNFQALNTSFSERRDPDRGRAERGRSTRSGTTSSSIASASVRTGAVGRRSEPALRDRVAQRHVLRKLDAEGGLRGRAPRGRRRDTHAVPEHRERRPRDGQLGHSRDRESRPGRSRSSTRSTKP